VGQDSWCHAWANLTFPSTLFCSLPRVQFWTLIITHPYFLLFSRLLYHAKPFANFTILRLSALIHPLYHPLYCLVIKILSSILISPAPIHPLYHPLSTVGVRLSLYLNISMWDLVLKYLL
jgi:hypothetical protein